MHGHYYSFLTDGFARSPTFTILRIYSHCRRVNFMSNAQLDVQYSLLDKYKRYIVMWWKLSKNKEAFDLTEENKSEKLKKKLILLYFLLGEMFSAASCSNPICPHPFHTFLEETGDLSLFQCAEQLFGRVVRTYQLHAVDEPI